MLKREMHDQFVIKPEVIPESAFLLEQRIAREQGHGDVEITEEFKVRKIAQIINNQTLSLDKWVDYLSSPDASYPDWAKYWAFRSMLEMGKFQKEEGEQGKETARFQKRTKDTVASFPALNPRALALTVGVLRSGLEEKAKPKEEQKPIENKSVKLSDKEFRDLLSAERFSKIYAQFLIEMPEYSTEKLQETGGKWVKYQQGSDANTLVKSLEGYPLEWCTADLGTAQSQLEGGDFYVYYSINEGGEAVIPRLAIRMQDNHIAEDPRGIAPDQNLDPYIVPILEERLKEFGPEGDAYKKKSADMKRLTAVENKIKNKEQLTNDDLIFIYEINAPIEGFDYQKDPRMEEIRKTRNLEEDMPISFGCAAEQIARRPQEINENTKAYVGDLVNYDERGKIIPIFQKLRHVENIYTSFPERKISVEPLEIGGKSINQFEIEFEQAGIRLTQQALNILYSPDFNTLPNPQQLHTVRLQTQDLNLRGKPTTEQLFQRAIEVGLELCPSEVALHKRLKDINQPLGEWYWIAVKQIADKYLFYLKRQEGGTFLHGHLADPAHRWNFYDEIVFGLSTPTRKVKAGQALLRWLGFEGNRSNPKAKPR